MVLLMCLPTESSLRWSGELGACETVRGNMYEYEVT